MARMMARPSGLLAIDRALQLGLVHRRAALDPEVAGLLVELVARPALGTVRAGPLPAAARRRHVLRRGPRPGARLARARPLLVDGARGDLLGTVLGRSL